MKKLCVPLIIIAIFLISPPLFAHEDIEGKYCHKRQDNESLVEARKHARTMAIRNALDSSRVFASIAGEVEDFQITDDLIEHMVQGYSKNMRAKYTTEDRIICCAIEWTLSPEHMDRAIQGMARTRAQPGEGRELLPPMVSEPEGLAQGPEIDIMVGIGKMIGDTTYRIGGTVSSPSGGYELHFPISELEFPLDVFMVLIEGSMEFAGTWKVSVGVKKNITSDAGKMKDSDWGYYYLEGYAWAEQHTLDIYSESDADLEALIVDINLRYRFYQKSSWAFFAGLGYMRQYFDYEVSNLDQWYPSDYYYFGVDPGHDYVSGKVLTYEVLYSIPYIEVGAQLVSKGSFSLEASIGYSPIVDVEDEDNHILRSKVSEGDCDGDALLFSLKERYNFPRKWFLALQLDYTTIETDGTQKQYTGGVLTAIIDQEIESKQIFALLSVGCSF